MKNKKQISYFRNSSKIQQKTVERGTVDTPNTHKHDLLLSWLSTGTSINSAKLN